MSTRPKAVVTGLDDLPFCPNCGGLGKVTDDELRFYAKMVRLATENLEKPKLTTRAHSWINGCIVGMLSVTVFAVAAIWLTHWVR